LADETSKAVERASAHWADFSRIVHARITHESDKRVRQMLERSNTEFLEAAE